MSSWNREDENSNEETQELCDSDNNPMSDHKLPNELSEGLGAIELTIQIFRTYSINSGVCNWIKYKQCNISDSHTYHYT
ncbi:hypothetical protein RhiirA4_470661 [Rhizophagus irregularis]|uniref:Uncharacterized protein n=1 Tax=Rhizophagus irregularis TaxID=588596 RepID=A0A2I1H1P5_9GLOM|nr:hypothetical protein RhiirA4_470661 [Rhizophagus irregularis]